MRSHRFAAANRGNHDFLPHHGTNRMLSVHPPNLHTAWIDTAVAALGIGPVLGELAEVVVGAALELGAAGVLPVGGRGRAPGRAVLAGVESEW